jgi:hypothetical protein
MFPKFLCTFLVILAASVGAPRLRAQEANDKPIVSVAANAKYGPIPNAPECFAVLLSGALLVKDRPLSLPGLLHGVAPSLA